MFKFLKSRKPGSIIEKGIINSISSTSTFIARHERSDSKAFQHYYQTDPLTIKKLLSSLVFKHPEEGLMRCGYDYTLYLVNEKDFLPLAFACFSCQKIYLTEHDKSNGSHKHIGYPITQKSFIDLLEKYCIPMVTDGNRYKETLKKYIDTERANE